MRFFAHDGQSTHGPAEVEELLKLPGFDGDTFVCPVGSTNSEDWKPALAYPAFKKALLSPDLPPPKIKTIPCPRCAHANPSEARYCNNCGVNLSAKITAPAQKRPAALAACIALLASTAAWIIFSRAKPSPTPAPPASEPISSPAAPAPIASMTATVFISSPPAPSQKPPVKKIHPSAPRRARRHARRSASRPAPKPASTPPPAPVTPPKPPAVVVSPQEKTFSLPGLEHPVTPLPQEDLSPMENDDQIALAQVHEQFLLCAQLLAKGAFSDHYDSCLCKDARQTAPYGGRRDAYVSALSKESSAGSLDNAAKIISSKLEGNSAIVTANWQKRPDDPGRNLTQIWRLEDGLWCRAP